VDRGVRYVERTPAVRDRTGAAALWVRAGLVTAGVAAAFCGVSTGRTVTTGTGVVAERAGAGLLLSVFAGLLAATADPRSGCGDGARSIAPMVTPTVVQISPITANGPHFAALRRGRLRSVGRDW
jgi:hypothetical protein